ncbi:unnamed protein product [Porites lobata]|uniref:Zinc finger PHD-type domain-containing protein n=1 Tax=Porites lobata TaxID=104759 RepID=A0ABN8P0A6_9CNID|nr:unnamed protein product [Porites lobata]
MCYCRQDTEEDTIKCCNPDCAILQFHLSCLGIDAIPKTWYCPKCRTLPGFKRGGSKHKSTSIISEGLKMNSICTYKTVANKNDKLVKCTNVDCPNGMFFHLPCLGRKRMPNNNKVWFCPACMMSNAQKPTEGTAPKPAAMHVTTNTRPTVTYVSTNSKPTVTHVSTNTKPMPAVTHATTKAEPTESSGSEEVTIVKTVLKKMPPRDKYGPEGKLGKYEYDLISSPNGWLDCVIIHEAHILLKKISTSIQGFQRPTLGPVHQFDIMTRPFIQIVNINNNHWECFSSINSPPGYVDVYDSLSTPLAQELLQLASDLTGPAFKGVRFIPVQQQKNASDCGVFSTAYDTSLVYGLNPMNVTYNISQMRPHLLHCLMGGVITPFPTS